MYINMPTGKELSKKERELRLNGIIQKELPKVLQKAFTFIDVHFDSEDTDKRRDAHKLAKQMFDKAIPNKLQIEKEDDGIISSDLADRLNSFLKENEERQKKLEITAEKEEDDEARGIPSGLESKAIYSVIRDSMGSSEEKTH